MGCFFPKNKSKVAQADHQYGSKSDHMSNNKPVVLPDPHNISREQPSRASPRSNRVKKGGKGGNDSISPTGSGSNSSSRLNVQFPRTLSAPHDYSFEDPAGGNVDGSSSAASATPFSAPLPSRPPPLDISSSPSIVTNSAPLTYGSSPLCCGIPTTVDSSAELRNALLEKKSSSFNDKKSFGGRPVRLPKPQTGGHPLPLPYSPDRSEAGSFVLSSVLASPIGASPSPSRGRDGYGPYSHAFRALSMGGHNPMDAKPLPPPALPTESRSPVRGFSFAELAQSFSPEFMLGDGVFGTAYRAWVDDGENKKIEVAVVCPVLKSLQGPKEWMAEVNWLARLQDPRLCKLIGYCADESASQDGEVVPRGSRRLLVYEYLCNGSLEKYLKGKAGRQLEWSTRMKIALDVAQGLAYLHDKAPFQVICRDLSPATIQLDKDFRAKVSGFGLARCGPEGDQASPMAGPYAAPESGLNGVVTLKSNAWSFGVILLELLTGRRHMDPIHAKEQQNLVQLTKPFLRDEGKLFLIVDPDLNGRYSLRGALKLANLAFQCLQKEASLRPSLSEAMEVLRTVQVDEDAVAADLKKSRSFSQSMTSPVSYSRSTSDILLRYSNEGKNSGELKQLRDREVSKTTAPGSVGSSPSYSELRQAGDVKQRERDFQRVALQIGLGASPAKSDSMGQLNESKQQEREPPRLPTLAQPLPVNDAKKQLPDSKQIERELRKLAGGSRLASQVKLSNHDAQKLPTPHLIDSIQPVDSTKQHGQEAQKLPSPAQPLQHVESSEKKEQASEAGSFPTPAGALEEPRRSNEMQDDPETSTIPDTSVQSIEGKPDALDSLQPTTTSVSSNQQVPEVQKSARPSSGSRASCAPALTFDPPMLREAF
ncbi:protein MpRLK-Pelle_RLCK-II [Marchantia polymorpha subsp. ruderalis]|uniref:Protein kinase domain-containing protein n=2 Tax=Marchantia polymorpha TaxID=3197 RepID=A0A176WMK8_MARPO|nr:hypothetical protein AXG93_3037s1040 [Marchantia polymorpha subsp. ruderalis]PTQ47956.1 hypothetical protein MARPO_0006s0008 [Marchantia polymorpha]BBN04519.1 hypothetical protein Mp_3g05350 [Marchantia polymorpha subsp. ruderalis]|eukprot:PTQ47956.1 hypothetical protein MARPO_0006s0008 [Marchantia polymorpha]